MNLAAAPTMICEFTPGSFSTYEVRPEDFTLPVASRQDLEGGVPKTNALITRRIFDGEKSGARTAVLLNAGAGLYIAAKHRILPPVSVKRPDSSTAAWPARNWMTSSS